MKATWQSCLPCFEMRLPCDNIGSDMGKMAPMSDALERQYGERAGQHLVDGGFVKFDDIDALAQSGVAVFAPVPKPR